MALKESIVDLSVRREGGPTAEPEAASASASAQVQYERFVSHFESLLRERDLAERLEAAGVSVRIDLADAPGMAITLLLRHPAARLVRGVLPERPDVRLVMLSSDLGAIVEEAEHLPMQILSGKVTFEGCVRKFLRVLPLIRGTTR